MINYWSQWDEDVVLYDGYIEGHSIQFKIFYQSNYNWIGHYNATMNEKMNQMSGTFQLFKNNILDPNHSGTFIALKTS